MPRHTPRMQARRAFTLIELLVVMAIIGVLIALLIPGVQAARNAARNSQSKNNLRQIVLAFNNYESVKRHYPPSWQSPDLAELNQRSAPPVDIAGWSILTLLLPHLEQKVISTNIDYDVPYNEITPVVLATGVTQHLSSLRVPTYLSPAEPRDEPRFGGTTNTSQQHYPSNYAINLGTWFVWDPVSRRGVSGQQAPRHRFLRRHGLHAGLRRSEGLAAVLPQRQPDLPERQRPAHRGADLHDGGRRHPPRHRSYRVDGRPLPP